MQHPGSDTEAFITHLLVQEYICAYTGDGPLDPVPIDANTTEVTKKKKAGEGTKVINLVKSIQKAAEEKSNAPFLIAMAICT